MSIQRIHLVRHGETSNPDGIVYGRRNFPLTTLGKAQAREAGTYLLKNYAVVGSSMEWMSSPVVRASQTAILARHMAAPSTGNPMPFTDLLTESISLFDGKRVPEVASLRENWKHLKDPHTPSWGEPYEQTFARMHEAMRIAYETGAKNAVLVGHQLPIWILRLGLEGRSFTHDPATRQCGHASVTTVTVKEGRITDLNYWANPVHEE